MLSYVERTLVPGESVKFRTRPHVLWMVNSFWRVVGWATVFVLLVNQHWLLAPLLAAYIVTPYFSHEYVITSRRIVLKGGLIARQTAELRLQKVESVVVDQSLMGRLLNYGDVLVVGTGGSEAKALLVSNPWGIREAFMASEEGGKA
jgi:uncharacterized membrane protein YdbT with pleckstrin-like domain